MRIYAATENSQRDSTIDFIKGIAIFLVLWGHSIQYLSIGAFEFWEDIVYKAIYSFHMPLFMFLSGYVFFWSCRKHPLTVILSKRIQSIGLPMLTWGIIFSILFLDSNQIITLTGLLKIVTENIVGFWFLWSVMVASFVTAISYKVFDDNLARCIVVFIAISLIRILPGTNNNLFVFPYFLAGFVASRMDIFHKKWYRPVAIISCVGWLLMLLFYQKKHYIYLSGMVLGLPAFEGLEQVQIDVFRYTIGCFGVLAATYILQLIYSSVQNSKVSKLFVLLGKKSLHIYVMQRLLLEVLLAKLISVSVNCIGYNYLAKNALLFDMFITVACALICGLILLHIVGKIEKRKWLSIILFGR